MSGIVADNSARASGVVAAASAGRTGTVDWDTTPKTGTVTAATGTGYFVNTTSGGITVNLPAGAAGSIVAVSDYASTSVSNPISIAANGSEKINGTNAVYTIKTAGLSVTLVYVDSTRGWKSVTGSAADATGLAPTFVAATGGTITTTGNYKYHAFTGSGTFCVSSAGNPAGSNSVNLLIIAGGGSGGRADSGGGGGAGGVRNICQPVAVLPYPITIGAGGAAIPGAPVIGNSGSHTTAFMLKSYFGGGGGADAGADGGSAGGGGYDDPGGGGNQPGNLTFPIQGHDGGDSLLPGGGGGGGGGAGSLGIDSGPTTPGPVTNGGAGGNGIDLSPTYGTAYGVCGVFAGGGGGSCENPSCGRGGPGGPGGGGAGNDPTAPAAVAGTANTGSGGGGAEDNVGASGAGGSGVVIIKYKFQ